MCVFVYIYYIAYVYIYIYMYIYITNPCLISCLSPGFKLCISALILSLCMYASICVRMHVCKLMRCVYGYVCMHGCMYVCLCSTRFMFACVSLCWLVNKLHTHTHLQTHMNMRFLIGLFVAGVADIAELEKLTPLAWVYVCIYVYIYIYIYIYIRTHTNTHTYIHVCIYIQT